MNFKKFSICSLMAVSSLFILPANATENQTKSVYFAAIIEHPSLDKVKKGVIDELKEHGYFEGENLKIRYQSAQGSMPNAIQIAKQFVSEKPDVIVALATPTAQALANTTKTIPIVFTAVTDPISAKLTSDWNPTNTNITGVSDYLSMDKQIDLIRQLKPDAKKIGFIYNPSEVNSVIVLKELRSLLPKFDMELIPVAAQRTSDISTAALSLKNKVDVIYSNTDNNVVSTYSVLVKIGDQYKIPLIASEPDSVARGASAALGMSYYDLGRQAGKQVIRILDGENAGVIAPEIGEKVELTINKTAAKKQGLELSDAVLQSANQLID